MSDPTAISTSAHPKYKRKLANYLLDKKLQLRYVLLVTVLSTVISASLGFMIYQQTTDSSDSIKKDLVTFNDPGDTHEDLQEGISSHLDSVDQKLVYEMIGFGAGLILILSAYLVIMTHKVAGPLFKVSIYFDRMAEGRLGRVTPLRRGDMLQDFYGNFTEAHEALRARAQADVASMEEALAKLRASQNQGDYRGEARQKLTEALEALDQHIAQRKKQLA